MTGAEYNDVNELVGQTGGGPLAFRGTLDEAGTVTVAGQPALVFTNAAQTNFTFSGTAEVNPGPNTVTVIAQYKNGVNATEAVEKVVC